MAYQSGAVQTSFDKTPYLGQPGQLYDFQTSSDGLEVSLAASGSLGFGRGVHSTVAAPNVCALPTTGTDAGRVRGITVIDNRVASGSTGYQDGVMVRLLQRGKVWVFAEGAVNDRAQAYCRITESTTGAGDQGQWRGDSDSGKAVAVSGARFLCVDGSISASGPVVLEVNFMAGGAVL